MLMKNISHMQVLIISVYQYYVISYIEVMYSSLWSGMYLGKSSPIYVFMFGDDESTKQWHHWSDRGEASIWMKNIIVPLILIFWDVDEKHFTYAGFDHFSILILCHQLCWSYVFLFVVWDVLGKELTHICLYVWWRWINKTVAPLVW